MRELITRQGEYLSTTFKGANGSWLLVGSESTSDKKNTILDTLDTFTDGKGNHLTVKRSQIRSMFQDKKIWIDN